MKRIFLRRAIALLAVTLCGLTLTSCSSSDAEPFCTDYHDAGGNLATFSVLQYWGPQQEVLDTIDSTVELLDEFTPPDEIAEPWETTRTLYTDARTIIEKGAVSQPDYVSKLNDINQDLAESSEPIIDYMDDHCSWTS